jgi:hypothetical protein
MPDSTAKDLAKKMHRNSASVSIGTAAVAASAESQTAATTKKDTRVYRGLPRMLLFILHNIHQFTN